MVGPAVWFLKTARSVPRYDMDPCRPVMRKASQNGQEATYSRNGRRLPQKKGNWMPAARRVAARISLVAA
jgi:hypothetical protein